MRVAASALLALLGAGPAAAQPAPSEMTIGEGAAALHGTLLAPATPADGAEPVLILAGSGPTDRDGNNPLGVRAAPYRLLAEALAERGIATLRVDKRGIAASAGAMPSEDALRVQHYADDALAWATALRSRTNARCVWLLGHSEGTLHALLAARQPDGICGLILVAPVGRRLGDTLRDQLRASVPPDVLGPALHILAELEAGRTVPGESVPPMLAPIFRPSVQPFLISLLAVDPPVLAANYAGPILVVAGTTDIQTPLVDAERIAGARPGIRLQTIEGMNHVLKTAPADRAANIATYADPALPLAPGAAGAIGDFVLAN